MTQFWKPQPREPWRDWRMFSMLVPAIVSAVGFFITGIFAFAFSDIAVIAPGVQSWMVIIGSALIVFGAELNTPFTTIEVFRKILRKEHNDWDISALIVSLVGTMINLLVTFATRINLPNTWQAFVLNWGPLLSGTAVTCDYYGAMVELGFLFGSFEMRMEKWLEERREWQAESGEVDSDAPTARVEDWREITAGMNGDRPRTVQGVVELLHKHGYQEPSKQTMGRWIEKARQ